MRPTVSAMSARSPVTRTVRRDARPRAGRRASGARRAGPGPRGGRRRPGSPSTATKTVRDPSRSARRRTWRSHAGSSSPTIQRALPSRTAVPPTSALEAVAVHLVHVGRQLEVEVRDRGRRRRGRWRAGAATPGRGRRRDAGPRSAVGGVRTRSTIEASSGRPWVSVPVLSKSMTSPAASASRAAPPLTTTPMRAARDSPDMIATGAASSSGHGVATTSTATARTGEPATAQATPASGEGERHEEHGEAVGGAHERRRRRPGPARRGGRRPHRSTRRPTTVATGRPAGRR